MRLFAEKGLNGVSVREINQASGQKNAGSINYHFSSRDELVGELIRDCARALDAVMAARLAALEAGEAPVTIRAIAAMLARPVSEAEAEALGGSQDFSRRFLAQALISHRDVMFDAIQDEDQAIRRAWEMVRALAPDLPGPVLQQRLRLALLYMTAAASAREGAKRGANRNETLWTHPAVEENLADTVEGMIRAPVSDETLAALGEGRS